MYQVHFYTSVDEPPQSESSWATDEFGLEFEVASMKTAYNTKTRTEKLLFYRRKRILCSRNIYSSKENSYYATLRVGT
jgi:hypothetical protein